MAAIGNLTFKLETGDLQKIAEELNARFDGQAKRIEDLEAKVEKLLATPAPVIPTPTNPTEPTPAKPEPSPVTPPPGVLTAPIRCESGKVYDGRGATIDAAGLGTVISVSGVKNVTVRNWHVINATGIVVDIWQSTNVIVENITYDSVTTIDGKPVASEPIHVVQCRRSQDVSILGVVADVVGSYLLWFEDVQDVVAQRCKLTTGSRNETGVRGMGSLVRLRLIDNVIAASLNPAKWTSLRIQGEGDDIEILRGRYTGLSNLGPMGEDDGGQKQTDPAKRRAMLSRRLTNVRSIDVVYVGGLGLMAGLEAQISGGQVIGHAGPEYKNVAGKIVCQNAGAFPLWKVTWSYPEKEHLRDGDPVRPAPVGHFRGVKFASAKPVKTLTYGNSNGSMKVIGCELNARPI